MVVGVVGLGLIGGSAAKAFKAAGHTIYAYDINESVTGFARLQGVDRCDTDMPRGDKIRFTDCERDHILAFAEKVEKFSDSRWFDILGGL